MIIHLTTETHPHAIEEHNPLCPCLTYQRGRTIYCQHRITREKYKIIFSPETDMIQWNGYAQVNKLVQLRLNLNLCKDFLCCHLTNPL